MTMLILGKVKVIRLVNLLFLECFIFDGRHGLWIVMLVFAKDASWLWNCVHAKRQSFVHCSVFPPVDLRCTVVYPHDTALPSPSSLHCSMVTHTHTIGVFQPGSLERSVSEKKKIQKIFWEESTPKVKSVFMWFIGSWSTYRTINLKCLIR